MMFEADESGREIGYSRRALFAKAMTEYLQSRKQARVTEYLDRVYGGEGSHNDLELVRKFKSRLTAAGSPPRSFA